MSTEDDKLFAEISAAIHKDDTDKLEELTTLPKEEAITTEVDEPELPPLEDEQKDDETQGASPADDTTQESDDDTENNDEDEGKDELSELKERLEILQRENHNLKSQAGRVPHVQRRIQELDKKLAELTAHAPSRQPPTIPENIAKKLEAIKEVDPDLAEVLQEIATSSVKDAQDAVTKQTRDTLTLLRDQEYNQSQEYEAALLLEMYPNAKEVFQSKSWQEWTKSQSKAVQGLAEADQASDVAKAFQLYEMDMLRLYPELKQQDPSPRAKQIEEDRARRQTGAAQVKTPKAPARQPVPDDPDALFAHVSKLAYANLNKF